ncbi:hypothetical protein [Jannaschia seohaensis]|uniref:Uncharacterized protein n=1 Tax=Jannaschia seohaensis TaxID=475081 RepID=A0A2Y9ABI5_9RHOB|nr:hypothetical protein [Jannaschia seohaensis]PWJ21355.1 hypothetical protein BCF38_102607 [Jannaschia seohaensis]SSA41961.1 hypothetical protein SAMN05421539_102607 [Jannaschia seohaensis]
MSYLTSISGVIGSANAQPGPAPSPTLVSQANARTAPPATTTAPADMGATAPGEITQTASRMPQVTGARSVNASSAARQ